MKTSTLVWIIVIILVVLAGGWYWYEYGMQMPQTTGEATQGVASTTTQGDGTPVGENLILGENPSTTLGTYLSAYNGMTVYVYNKDTAGVSNCSGACAAAWPPYTVPTVSDVHVSAATKGVVGTITRQDGTIQVTYNGLPLYFWQGDIKPGDTTGQNVGGFTVAKS